MKEKNEQIQSDEPTGWSSYSEILRSLPARSPRESSLPVFEHGPTNLVRRILSIRRPFITLIVPLGTSVIVALLLLIVLPRRGKQTTAHSDSKASVAAGAARGADSRMSRRSL